MTNDIIEILKQNGWNSFPNVATEEDIANLEKTFNTKIPEDYKKLLRFSDGGSLYGFKTPLTFYPVETILVLYDEFDYYQDIPQSLIFGNDGGSTIYAYDLRDEQMNILFFRLDDARYDNIIYEAESLSDLIIDIISNKQINL